MRLRPRLPWLLVAAGLLPTTVGAPPPLSRPTLPPPVGIALIARAGAPDPAPVAAALLAWPGVVPLEDMPPILASSLIFEPDRWLGELLPARDEGLLLRLCSPQGDCRALQAADAADLATEIAARLTPGAAPSPARWDQAQAAWARQEAGGCAEAWALWSDLQSPAGIAGGTPAPSYDARFILPMLEAARCAGEPRQAAALLRALPERYQALPAVLAHRLALAEERGDTSALESALADSVEQGAPAATLLRLAQVRAASGDLDGALALVGPLSGQGAAREAGQLREALLAARDGSGELPSRPQLAAKEAAADAAVAAAVAAEAAAGTAQNAWAALALGQRPCRPAAAQPAAEAAAAALPRQQAAARDAMLAVAAAESLAGAPTVGPLLTSEDRARLLARKRQAVGLQQSAVTTARVQERLVDPWRADCEAPVATVAPTAGSSTAGSSTAGASTAVVSAR